MPCCKKTLELGCRSTESCRLATYQNPVSRLETELTETLCPVLNSSQSEAIVTTSGSANLGGHAAGRVEITSKSTALGIISIASEPAIGFADCGDGVCEAIPFKVPASAASLARTTRARRRTVETADHLLASRIILATATFVCIPQSLFNG